ncbi:MAG: universal stress protein [Chloroflexota bacterium]
MTVRRILVAFDGSEAAYRALEQAIESADVLEAQIDVVTVLQPEIAAAHQAAELLIDRGFEPEIHTPTGDPAAQIARLASKGEYDVVYLGTRGRGSLVRALEGSVSSTVAETTDITVVIAR